MASKASDSFIEHVPREKCSRGHYSDKTRLHSARRIRHAGKCDCLFGLSIFIQSHNRRTCLPYRVYALKAVKNALSKATCQYHALRGISRTRAFLVFDTLLVVCRFPFTLPSPPTVFVKFIFS